MTSPLSPSSAPPAIWDAHAAVYEKTWERQLKLWGFDALVLGRLPDPATSRWLDVGHGPGEPALTVAAMGYDVTAIDVSKVMFDRIHERIAASERKLKIDVRMLDGETLEGLDDNSFDVVSSMFGVFLFADRDAAWRSALRVLKPGGRLLATSWDSTNNNAKMVRFVTQHAVDERPGPTETVITPSVNKTVVPATFREELEQNGFTDVEIYTLSHPLCFFSGEEYIIAILDNPALYSMVGHKEETSLKRCILDFALLASKGVDPFSEEAANHVANSSGSAENHPLWAKPFSFPAVGNVAIASKPSL